MIRRGDKLLIVIIVMVALSGYGYKLYNDYKYKGTDSIVSIEINGKSYGEYNLKKTGDREMKLNLPDNEVSIVEFKDGKVRVKEANCPDKVCVRTGWVSKPGQMIVCLPYRIVIKVAGERQDVDVNVY